MPRAKTPSTHKKVRKLDDRSRSLHGRRIDADVDFKMFDLRPPSRRYRGELKQPIARASKLDLAVSYPPDEQERVSREEDAEIFAGQVDKLFLLLDHFGIARTSRLRWFHLAFQLARQHVPGMKIAQGPKPSRGRKSKWGKIGLDAELVYLVAVIKREREKGVADSIRILMKRYPNQWGQFPERSLRTRYFEAIRRIGPARSGSLIDSLGAWLMPDGPSK